MEREQNYDIDIGMKGGKRKKGVNEVGEVKEEQEGSRRGLRRRDFKDSVWQSGEGKGKRREQGIGKTRERKSEKKTERKRERGGERQKKEVERVREG